MTDPSIPADDGAGPETPLTADDGAGPETPLTADDRVALGKQRRRDIPRSALAELSLADRPDPLEIIAIDDARLIPEALPVRRARMLESEFAYFRGTAAVMAADLARGPSTGLVAQLSGDAHLSNFGAYTSPERRVDFDFNSYHETAIGPWEWDLKRLLTSIEIAGREQDFGKRHRRRIVQSTSRAYRLALRSFAHMTNLGVWHSKLDAKAIMDATKERQSKSQRKRVSRAMAKTASRETLAPLRTLTHEAHGLRLLVDSPPLVERVTDDAAGAGLDPTSAAAVIDSFAEALPMATANLLRSYHVVDVARLTIGVGTVGIGRWLVLMTGRDSSDLLFLHLSEPAPSALIAALGPSPEPNNAARVVAGQRVMQSDADMFLGWTTSVTADGAERAFAVRHLRDQRGSADIAAMTVEGMTAYAHACAWTLAQAHARSGDRIAINSYLGASDAADRALHSFAEDYADLNEKDFRTFRNAHG